jgi:TolB-like protein
MMSDPSKTVFISYASEDAQAAGRLAAGLRAAGVEVWFDQKELVGGENWDARIRDRIRSCFLFVPIISASTEKRLEGYFRREWEMAADRTHNMARGKAFLLPVYLGRSVHREAEVPDEFRQVHWTCLDEGVITPSFLARVQHLLAGDRTKTPARPRPQAGSPPGQRPRMRAWPLVLGSGLFVALAAGYFLTRSPDRGPAAISGAAPAAIPAPAPNPRSIAVLAPSNPAADPAAQALADSLQIDAIAALSRLPEPVITPRDATLAFKASDRPVAEIARQLNVATVIAGSVLRTGDRVSARIELRAAGDPRVLWSKNYDVGLKDAKSYSLSISDEVARMLEAREARGTFASAKFTTGNSTAADLFEKAWQLVKATDSSKESLEQGVELAEECMQLDPGYTTAAVLLTDAHARLFSLYTDPEKRSSNAAASKQWAEKASQLTQGGDGEIGLAIYYIQVEHDPGHGATYVEDSLRTLPNEALSYHLKASALSQSGRMIQAIEQDRLAVSLDPLMGGYWEGILTNLARLRRPAEWTSAWKECNAANPERLSGDHQAEARFILAGELPGESFEPANGWKSTWQIREGRFKEALDSVLAEMANNDISEPDRLSLLLMKSDALQRLRRGAESADAARAALAVAEHLGTSSDPDHSRRDGWMAQALARVGRADEAALAAQRYVAAVSESDRPLERWNRAIEVAELYAYMGRARECLALLSKLVREPSGLSVPMLKVDPAWDNVRNDAAFRSLILDPKNLRSF